MNTTTQRTKRNLFAAAAATVLMALSTVAQAGDNSSGLTREQVRKELAEARMLGLLDQPGELGATDRVLAAREMYNQTQTQMILAQFELEQRIQAEAQAAAQALADEQTASVDGGTDSPILVVVRLDAAGAIVDATATEMQVVSLDKQ